MPVPVRAPVPMPVPHRLLAVNISTNMASSSSRVFRKVDLDKYYSPKVVADLVRDLCTFDTLYVDPCAGDNALYDVMPAPKLRFDIQDGTDFFTTNRALFGQESITFVMNPPFSLSGQRNGVVMFLNHAEQCMRQGEYVICVVPQTMRKWTNIAKVSPYLHLLSEYVFRKRCDFENNGKIRKVSIAVQVWQMQRGHRLEPLLLKSSPDFKATYAYPGTFYMKVWGVVKSLGLCSDEEPTKDTKYRTKVGTLDLRGKGGTAICIRVHGDEQKVKERFRKMFEDGEWLQLMSFKCAGNNNPMATSTHIYTLYEKGLQYMKKERYGVKVFYI